MITRTIAAFFVGAWSLAGSAQATLIDRGGGLIYDDVLDVTWLQDANYGRGSSYDDVIDTNDGRMTWNSALEWAANLTYYDSLRDVIFDDWRLPAIRPINGIAFNHDFSFDGSTDFGYNITSPVNELAYMFHVNLANSAHRTASGDVSGCWISHTDTCLDNVGPFINLGDEFYWSGTESEFHNSSCPGCWAWAFDMGGGSPQSIHLNHPYTGSYAWAVRDGDVAGAAAVPEPETDALVLAGLGLIGFMASRRKIV